MDHYRMKQPVIAVVVVVAGVSLWRALYRIITGGWSLPPEPQLEEGETDETL